MAAVCARHLASLDRIFDLGPYQKQTAALDARPVETGSLRAQRAIRAKHWASGLCNSLRPGEDWGMSSLLKTALTPQPLSQPWARGVAAMPPIS